MDWHRNYVITEGYTEIMSPSRHGLKYLSFGILRLQAGRNYSVSSGHREVGLILVGGKCTVNVGKRVFKHIGRRESFFNGKATALYIPPRTKYAISANTELEVAIGSVPTDSGGVVALIRPTAVTSKLLGHGPTRRRVDLLIYESIQASRLIVGETFHSPGGWSGYPPHKHDEDRLPVESANEEVYLIKIEPPQGFGFLSLYNHDGLNEVYKVKNNDVVAIPHGYHPMVAAPGYKFGFIWFMAGTKRVWKPVNDPDHSWTEK